MLRLCTETMTVYNMLTDETWQRTVVEGVQWRHDAERTQMSGGVLTSQRVESITIDFTRAQNYLPPREWRALDDKAGKWTLDPSGNDYVVLGVCEQELSASYTPSKLRRGCGACQVLEVADNRNRPRLKNIKVVAK